MPIAFPALCCHRQEKWSASGSLLSGFRMRIGLLDQPWRLQGVIEQARLGLPDGEMPSSGTTEP